MVSMTTHNPFPSSPRKQEVLLCPKRWDKPQKQTTGVGVGHIQWGDGYSTHRGGGGEEGVQQVLKPWGKVGNRFGWMDREK